MTLQPTQDKHVPIPSPSSPTNSASKLVTRKLTPDTALYVTLFGQEDVKKKRFVNIGAGAFRHPAWTTVDYVQPAYEKLLKKPPDINHDLSTGVPLPIEDGTINLVYTSHTVEHLTDEMDQRMFGEAIRMLKPGGLFRVTCPNAELAWHALKRNDMSYFRTFTDVFAVPGGNLHRDVEKPLKVHGIHYAFLQQVARQCCYDQVRLEKASAILDFLGMEEALDSVCALCSWEENLQNPGYHLNWFTEAKLRRMLTKAGFTTVLRSGFRQSLSPVLRNTDYFDRTRPNFSIYIDAIK